MRGAVDRLRRCALLGIGLLPLVFGPPAQADSCPAGNLLQGAVVRSDVGVLHAGRLTDGVIVPEGVPWDTRQSAVVVGDAALSFDLGEPREIVAMLLQGDHRGPYIVRASTDGRTWNLLWQVPAANANGMRLRHSRGIGQVARWIRVEPPRTGSAYALTEVQAYCRLPEAWPPSLALAPGLSDPTLRANPRNVQLDIAMHRTTVAVLGWLVFFASAVALRRPRILSFAAALALSSAAMAYLLYQGAFQPFRTDRWLMAATVCAAGTVALALIVSDFRRAGTSRSAGRLSALAALLSGAAALLYGIGVALIYGMQSPGAAAVFLTATLTAAYAAGLRRHRMAGEKAALLDASMVLVVVSGLYGSVYFFTYGHWGAVVKAQGPASIRNVTMPGALVLFHDQFHYYLGARYFAELGYDRLYRCVAEAERDNGRGIVVASGPIRDLRTNALRDGNDLLAEPDPCRTVFTPARWAQFRADVDYFRTRVGQGGNERFFVDHGYNASPFWTFLNRPIAASSDARDATLRMLAGIDVGLLFVMFALMWWAFGLHSAALAALLVGTCSLWVYDAQGVVGSFGRLYWVFGVVAAVCLLRRGWFATGGAALSLAVLDRIFPAAFAFGPAFIAAAAALRRRFDPRLGRVLIAAGVSVAVFGGLSVAGTGGVDTVAAFLANSSKHRATPLTNYIGLRTLVSTTPRSMSSSVEIPEWKDLRTRTFLQRQPAYWIAASLLLVFTAWVCWRAREPWKLVIAGLLPMFCMFDLTNYYTIVLIVLAPLAVGRLADLLALLGASLASQFILQHAWETAIFPLYSLLILALLLWFLGSMARRSSASDAPPDAATSARS